ncbi:sugar kinase [bacterium]|nr:sugar kinase [FCB group bacterium]MBL7191006.1 sugar kinase [bacterium]
MSILVVGSVAYDSLETPYGSMEKALGGSAVYFTTAASLFAPVNVVGVVGDDYDFSDLDFLQERKADLSGVIRKKGDTFAWKGVYGEDPNERETIYTRLGVFADFKPEIPESFRKSGYVFLANIDPDLQIDVLTQVDRPKLVVLDTMNFWIESKRESLNRVLEQTDVLIVNDSEAKQLTVENNLFTAAGKLFDLGPKIVVIKKGEHGALLLSKTDKFFAPIYPVEKVKDPTGAGDTFAGGFMGYIGSQDKTDWDTLKKAVIYGAAAASFTVEDFSILRLKNITAEDVNQRVGEIKKMTEF